MESQIVELLKLAREQLTYSEFIINYPKSVGVNNFDPSSKRDIFYKNVCNVCFYDSLLITTSLLSKDPRIISFWNWKGFISRKQKELERIKKLFESYHLKELRDEVVAHADFNNPANRFPYLNKKGIINEVFVKSLGEIQLKLIDEFFDYTKQYSTPYAKDSFSVDKVVQTIKDVMSAASPRMTQSSVI